MSEQNVSPRPYIDVAGIIFQIHHRVPVFHGFDFDSMGTENEKTRCGLKLEEGWRRATVLPIFHAENIADPCARCFPGQWNQTDMRAVGSLPQTVAAARARMGAGSQRPRASVHPVACPRYLEGSGADLQPTHGVACHSAPDTP